MLFNDWPQFYNKLVEFRRHVHAHPEVAMEEFETAESVLAFAQEIGFDHYQEVAKPGLVFSIYPKGMVEPKKNGIMFRAELDGLPIPDESTHSYRSTIDGKGHLCGHDGHMTMLLALMYATAKLKKANELNAPIHFLFQPAEENGAGAKAMLNDPTFDYEPKYIFSLHNIPGAPLGQILHKSDVFTPEVISVDFKLKGETSHAAQPHLGNNPAALVYEIIDYMRKLHKYNPTSKVSSFSEGDVIVAPVQIKMGQADYGISAGNALVGYTFRTYRPEQLNEIRNSIEQKASEWANDFGMVVQCSWHQYFAANINDQKASDLALSGMQKANLATKKIKAPFEWGEDFGNFTQKIPACMFGLGSGEAVPPLHNQQYDFPDQLIPYGLKAFLSIVYEYNGLNPSDLVDEFEL